MQIRARHRAGIALAAMLVLAGCSALQSFKPKPPFLKTEIDFGPEEYRQGYKDGCESGMATFGSSLYKSVYRQHRDPRYEKNQMYNQVWRDAYNYCYQWIFVWNKEDGLL